METNKNYFQVGLFVIGMIIVGIGFTLWLTNVNKGNYDHYFIRFAESVSGLNKKSVVKFHGVDIGIVDDINIDLNNPKLIKVDISVLESAPIKTDTIATLKLHGITGEVYIELSGNNNSSPDLRKDKGDKSLEIKSKLSDISTVINGVPRFLDKANHAVDQINKIFNDENIQTINNLAKKLGKYYGGK